MLRITRSEAGRGLVDFGRIEEMLARIAGRIDVVHAPHVTPLAAPLLLEIGRVPITGHAARRGWSPRRRRRCWPRPVSRPNRAAETGQAGVTSCYAYQVSGFTRKTY